MTVPLFPGARGFCFAKEASVKRLLPGVFLLLAAFVAACAPVASLAPTPAPLVDDLGRPVTLKGRADRIVSLAPSNTEILFALGLGDRVVGTDNYSDYPE